MRFFSSSSHRSGPFPAAICAALFGDDDAFALPFPDERALELGEGHDREHQIGHRGILAGEGEALFQELDPDAASGKRLHQPTQIIEVRSEEHTSELQSLMRISYAVLCWKKKNTSNT